MEQAGIAAAAGALARARTEHQPVDALTPDATPESLDDAYQVQAALIDTLGHPPVGWKVGCTSPASQKMLGADQPFAGRLLAPLTHTSPARLRRDDFFTCGLEAEFAFRLGADLPGAGAPYDEDAVAVAVAGVHTAIEIVDGCYPSWTKAGIFKIISDNGAHGSSILGPLIEDWRAIDYADHPVAMRLNDEEISTGTGANVLGHPLRSLTWLANERARRGGGLAAGEIVTTGSCCAGLGWAEKGDRAVADFGSLGTVEVSFD